MPAKTCPVCATVNRGNAVACDCGHPFADEPQRHVDQLRAMLVRKLNRGRLASLGGLVVVLATSAIMGVTGSMLLAVVEMVGLVLLGRGAATVINARHGLRALEPKPLPVARLLE